MTVWLQVWAILLHGLFSQAFYPFPGPRVLTAAGGAVSFVNANGCDFGNNATSCTFTLALTAGNFLIGQVNTNPTNTTGIGDTADTFTRLSGSPFISASANGVAMDAWTAPVTSTGTKTFTCTSNNPSTAGNCGFIQISGTNISIDRQSPFVPGGAGDNGSQASPATVITGTTAATTANNEILVDITAGGIGTSAAPTIVANLGFTMRQDTVIGFGRYYAISTKNVSVSGAYSGSDTVTASGCCTSVAVLVTLVGQ